MKDRRSVPRWSLFALGCLSLFVLTGVHCEVGFGCHGGPLAYHTDDDAFIGDGEPVEPDSGDGGLDDGGPCVSARCTHPPAALCLDAARLEYYDATGTCIGDECDYRRHTQTCSGRCAAGACVPIVSQLYVDARNAGNEDGSRAHPFRSISRALAVAADGVKIAVAEGTYAEQLSIGVGAEVIGGFVGASAADYASGKGGDFDAADPKSHEVVIDAPTGPTISVGGAQGASLSGLTITGAGRGILCSAGALTITHCLIRDNHTESENGGGVFGGTGCQLALLDSTIANNSANRGGGVAMEGGSIEVRRCTVRGNTSHEDHGGGLYLAGAVEVHDNWIEGNSTGVDLGFGWGGGMVVAGEGTIAHLSGNVVTGNTSPSAGAVFLDDGVEAVVQNDLYFANSCGELGGAGLYVDGLSTTVRSHVELRNLTIADHDCPGPAGGMLVEDSTVTLSNSILWNNGGGGILVADGGEITVRYSDIEVPQAGEGNISRDPLFAGGQGVAAFALRSTAGRWDGAAWVIDDVSSPCIDAGDPASSFASEPQPNGGRVNMGAFGGTAHASMSP